MSPYSDAKQRRSRKYIEIHKQLALELVRAETDRNAEALSGITDLMRGKKVYPWWVYA